MGREEREGEMKGRERVEGKGGVLKRNVCKKAELNTHNAHLKNPPLLSSLSFSSKISGRKENIELKKGTKNNCSGNNSDSEEDKFVRKKSL